MPVREPCRSCGALFQMEELDAKPTMTTLLRSLQFVRGQSYVLRYAADRGYDFDRLECRKCYGPCFEAL